MTLRYLSVTTPFSVGTIYQSLTVCKFKRQHPVNCFTWHLLNSNSSWWSNTTLIY